MFKRTKLIRLIDSCDALPSHFDNLSLGRSLRVSEVLEPFTRRKETAGDKFDGFPEVLEMLAKETSVRIHSITARSKYCAIFTDDKISEILGILAER